MSKSNDTGSKEEMISHIKENLIDNSSDQDESSDKEEVLAIADSKFKLDSKEGVVFIGNIPHGFYENEIKQYFSQFGEVVRLRVSRNLRTFKPRGYAYVQFRLKEVAEIVVKTMNNYILLENILRCDLMDPTNVHDNLFHPSLMNRKRIDYKAISIQSMGLPRTAEEKLLRVKRRLEKEEIKRKKLKEAGIEYKFEALSNQLTKKQLKQVHAIKLPISSD